MGTRALEQGRRQGFLLVQIAGANALKAPILVTGAHRSGTTWVGRMLCASGEAGYVHEPFNPNRSPGWFLEPLPYWFMHIDHTNESHYVAPVRRMIEFRYPTARALVRSRSIRVVAMNLQQAAAAARDRLKKKRLLLKDPLALLSAEWLAERFNMRILVLVRHPASFVSSIKRLNWGFDYERNWLAQTALMENLFAGYEERFSGYRGEVDLVGEGIVVWNALYDVVSKYRERHPEWVVRRYEDIALSPISSFRSLYDEFDLQWSDAVEERISAHSDRTNPGEVPEPHRIRRDSVAASRAWRQRLSQSEVERIRSGTKDVWQRFYTEADWEASDADPG